MSELTCVEINVSRPTVAVSNTSNVNLHEQIFVYVLWTVRLVRKIRFRLVHAINLHVESARLISVAQKSLTRQKRPLMRNEL